ncbi:MAG TPA: DUF992 domain-containing protein [Bradyrhizobium sp.]
MRLSTLSIAIVALVAPIASANALPPVRAGILQCQGGQNVGFVVGSVTSLECVFQSEGRRPEPYIATVRRYGLDIGFTEQTKFSWAVNAPTGRVGRGDLAGNYGGVGANASVGVGGGGNFLVGGQQNSYALQPLSVQGQTGLNVAAGVADIELQPVRFGHGGPRGHTRRHHRHG